MENKLLFLGTGAGDWLIERRGNSKFWRRYCSVLINDDLLIDPGPHIYDFSSSIADPELYSDVKNVLVSHRHADHFSNESLTKLSEKNKVNLFCDDFTFLHLDDKNIVNRIKPVLFEKIALGDYFITALPSNHAREINGAEPYHFIIETKDEKTLFYGLDGSGFTSSEWEEMKRHKFDIMILDSTIGFRKDERVFEHNDLSMLKILTNEIYEEGLLKDGGTIFASHFSKKLMPPHLITEKILNNMGVAHTYDGLEINF